MEGEGEGEGPSDVIHIFILLRVTTVDSFL